MPENKKNRNTFWPLVLFLLAVALSGREDLRSGNRPKSATLWDIGQFDRNQIRAYLTNQGDLITYSATNDAGLEWPRGSGLTAIFQTGHWLVGKVNDQIRTSVIDYTSEYNPGTVRYDPATPAIPGQPHNPDSIRFRIYKIQRGDSPDPASPLFNPDYLNWPVADGAPANDGEYFTDGNGNQVYDIGEPFEDFNRNSVYDPPDGQITEGADPPLQRGDQTLWFVINDFLPEGHAHIWNTPPLGVEIQMTVFGFDESALQNVMFARYLIINKSGTTINDAYFGFFSDMDIGNAMDDMVACDSARSLGYCYNGPELDLKYGYFPPAVGISLIQGPIVPAAGEWAWADGHALPDFRNLPMTACLGLFTGQSIWSDPNDINVVYFLMQGLDNSGNPILHPSGNPTKFTFSGDPMSVTGWLDERPGDKRLLMSSGPFNMDTWQDSHHNHRPEVGEPGVQEIIAAVLIAPGTNHLQAITNLKDLASLIETRNYFGDNRPHQQITAPVNGTTYTDSLVIRWTDDANFPLAQYVTLQFSPDNGQTYRNVASLTTNPGYYQWDIAAEPDVSQGKIRLVGYAGERQFGLAESDGTFKLDNPAINVPPLISNLIHSPGYELNLSGDYLLHWEISDPDDANLSVALEMQNRYQSWETIALNLPAVADWNWATAQFPNSSACHLRLRVTAGGDLVYKEFPHQFLINNARRRIVPLQHSAGAGNPVKIQVAVIDSTQQNDHEYEIHFHSGIPKSFSVIDLKLAQPVLDSLPILDQSDESPAFDGLTVTIEDSPYLRYIPDFSGWIKGDCNWTYDMISQSGRYFASQYEIRFTLNGSLDINNTPAPFEVWNTTYNYQPKFLLATQTATKYLIGVYELFQGTEQIVWVITLQAPSDPPSRPPETGNIIRFFVAVPLTDTDVYRFTNSPVKITPESKVPSQFRLLPVFPNPFNPVTTLRYQLPEKAQVTISVYNLTGQLVTTLVREPKQAGTHLVTWNAGNSPSGIYLICMTAGNFHKVQKCVLLR